MPLTQPVIAIVRPLTTPSPLEELMIGAEKRISIVVHLYHSYFHDSLPGDRLLALLPIPSLLKLRAVSHITKKWVDEHHPDLMKRLRVPCPLPRHALQWNSTLRHLSHGCQHLTIKLSPFPRSIPKGTFLNPSPTGQIFNVVNNFSSLRIIPPSKDSFEPLHSLRLTLESTFLQNLTHIHIEPLSLAGLLALRWGGFDTFTDSTWIGQSFWRGIKSLRIGMDNEWPKFAHTGLEKEEDGQQRAKMKDERELYRLALQVLHNYFFHFSLHRTLEKLRFDWVGGDMTGLNPLLLDEVVVREEGAKWFSAPGNEWKALKEIWLGSIAVDGAQVNILKRRQGGLKKMMVWESVAAPELCGEIQVIEGKAWLNVNLKVDYQETAGLGEFEDLFDTEEGEVRNRAESMVVPFLLRL